MDADPHIPADEFAKWVPVRDAYLALSNHFGDTALARSTLLRRLMTGVLISAAKIAIRHPDGDPAKRKLLLIKPDFWRIIPAGRESVLWTTSEVDVDLRPDGHYRDLADEDMISYIGIRFDRDGLNDIHPLFEDESASISDGDANPSMGKRRQDLPMLPETIAQAWMAWFKSQPSPSKERAEKAALHMFPNHNLSRDRIRDLFGESSLGRPRNTDS